MCEFAIVLIIYRNLLTFVFLRSISLGISRGDGTLHIGFDQHDNDLRYRVSRPGVATQPSAIEWSADLFGPVMVRLCSIRKKVILMPSIIVNVEYAPWPRLTRQIRVLRQRNLPPLPHDPRCCEAPIRFERGFATGVEGGEVWAWR
jgi:hypothetical protein